ncbi:flagellar hook-length control protein FliK, partial [Paracoccaceae bacterium]|nr:flagellar hook-length control protein FliK [Paracoccaceae bacterium]
VISPIDDQVSSDDISAFLKGLNVSSDKDKIDSRISTLQLLGRLSKEEVSLIDLNETQVATAKNFMKDFLSYIEMNSNKSEKALGLGIGNINASTETVDLLNFISSEPDGIYTSEIKISEYSGSIASLKKLSFADLNNTPFLYETNDEFENVNKTSFLLNTDISNEESLSEKKAIEIKVTQNPNLFSIKAFDISDDKIKIAGDVLNLSSSELETNQLDGKNTLIISIPKKDLAFVVLNVDVNNQDKFDFTPLPIVLKPSDAFQKFYEVPSANIKAARTNFTEISKVLSAPESGMIDGEIKAALDQFKQVSTSIDKTISANEKIAVSLAENSSKFNSSGVNYAMKMSLPSSKSSMLTNEQVRFLAEKLQKVNNAAKLDLISNNQIAEFVVKSRGNFAIDSAISKVVKSEFKTSENISAKKNLFISTADVIGYRQGMITSSSDNKLLLKEYSFFDNSMSLANTLGGKGDPDLLERFNFPLVSNLQENSINLVQPSVSNSRIDQAIPQPQVSTNTVTPQKLSLLDAQFTSRMATTLLEQAISSKENFDLILEPESFGKVRVNVSLENLQLDVKLTAENSATLAVLRASEAVLQSITEVNGLKLAEYNVELSNNNQNNSGSREQKENSGEKDAKTSGNQNELDDKLDSSIEDGSHNLNLIA